MNNKVLFPSNRFFLNLILLFVANLLFLYSNAKDLLIFLFFRNRSMQDWNMEAGWPFTYYEFIGFVGAEKIHWHYLLLNVLIFIVPVLLLNKVLDVRPKFSAAPGGGEW